jgi:hypothetical protein
METTGEREDWAGRWGVWLAGTVLVGLLSYSLSSSWPHLAAFLFGAVCVGSTYNGTVLFRVRRSGIVALVTIVTGVAAISGVLYGVFK